MSIAFRESLLLRSNRLIARLSELIKRNAFKDFVILFILNLVLAFNYLSSASDKIPGFRYRMDGYSYPLFANLLVDLLHHNILPLGDVWVPQVGAGYTFFIVPDPLFVSYSIILTITGDFILAYKILLFLLYLSSGITCYYLATVLLAHRGPRLVAAISYTFSQTTLYEVSLGHLSMVYGMALLPAIIGFLLKGYRESRLDLSILSGFFLFFLIVEREDYGYMMLGFIVLLMMYHLVFRKGNLRSVITSTILAISTGLIFSFPYLQTEILSKLSLWEQAGVNYAAYSPTLLQLFVPIFSNVEAYLGDVTIVLVIICLYGLVRGKTRDSVRYEAGFFYMLSVISLFFVILGLGSTTPIYAVLYTHLPTLTGFRAVAGNPTYWLQPSKLCLALLCGAGAGILSRHQLRISQLKLRIPWNIALAILVLVLVLDGATFLARNEPYSPIPGWNAILPGVSNYNTYQLLQTASIPDGASVYEHMAMDPGNYNVLEIPSVYTLPDYQYLNYLSKTNITMLNPYGVPNIPSIFSEIYSYNTAVSATTGNATILASGLALLGVKYVVYQGVWGGPYFAEGLAQSTTPFQLVMQDGNVSLFRNMLYGANIQLSNLLQGPGFEESNSSIWQPWNVSDTVRCTAACFDNSTAHSGVASLRLVASGPSVIAGRNEFINASYLAPGKYGVSGWNRAVNVSADAEYGIRVQATYQNGSEVTLAYAPFQTGTHDWQYSQTFFDIKSADRLTQLAVSTYLRSGAGGAWVDDMNLHDQVPLSNWTGVFAVRSLHSRSSDTIAQDNLAQSTSTLQRLDRFHFQVNVQLGESAVMILPLSFDPGWIVTSASGTRFHIAPYEGLMALSLAGGNYPLLFYYSSYQSSLNETLLVYSFGLFAVTAMLFGNLYIQKRSSHFREARFMAKRRVETVSLWTDDS